jgi:hypothetical protein
MKHSCPIIHCVLRCLVLLGLFCAPAALAQQADLSAMNDVIYYAPDVRVFGANFIFQAQLPSANASLAPLGSESQFDGAGRWMQSVALEWDRSHVNSWVAYTSTAPTGQHAPGVPNNTFYERWTGGVTSGTSVDLAKKKTTVASLTTDWEIRGQEQYAKPAPAALGQSFTMEWGVSHLLPLNYQKTRLLAFGVAGYDGWQISGNSALLPGGVPFSAHAVGLQTAFILPTKNLGLSFKYEPEYLTHPAPRGRVIMFGASWTW